MKVEIHHNEDTEYPWACVVVAARDRQVAMGKGVTDILGELSMWCMDNVGGDDWCVTERGWIDTGYTETGRVWWFQHQEDAVQFQLTWG